MVSHYPAKVRDNRYCGNGNVIFLVIEELDSPYLLKSAITIYL